MTTIKRDLHKARDSTKSIKYNGTIEPNSGHANEIGKERCVNLLKKKVKDHGQQTVYWIRNSNNKVMNLFENAHCFKLSDAISEHVHQSKQSTDYESYDNMERDEDEILRTVVESLHTKSFQEKLVFQFEHCTDFDTLPGSCLCMMALETCNSSVFHDIERAKKKLEALNLNSYPEENMTAFSSEAQYLIMIIQAAFSMSLNLGSSLNTKVTHTSSEVFNRKMWALLDTVKTAELEYELSDPKLFLKHNNHAILEPLVIVATMQSTHSMLLSQYCWPVLTNTIPQSNNMTALNTIILTNFLVSSNLNNPCCCFCCNGDHLVWDCPHPAPLQKSTNGNNNYDNNINNNFMQMGVAPWKY
jgi:hypothetical protein